MPQISEFLPLLAQCEDGVIVRRSFTSLGRLTFFVERYQKEATINESVWYTLKTFHNGVINNSLLITVLSEIWSKNEKVNNEPITLPLASVLPDAYRLRPSFHSLTIQVISDDFVLMDIDPKIVVSNPSSEGSLPSDPFIEINRYETPGAYSISPSSATKEHIDHRVTADLKEKVDIIFRHMYMQNGNSLTTKVVILEDNQKELNTRIDKVEANVSSLIGSVNDLKTEVVTSNVEIKGLLAESQKNNNIAALFSNMSPRQMIITLLLCFSLLLGNTSLHQFFSNLVQQLTLEEIK